MLNKETNLLLNQSSLWREYFDIQLRSIKKDLKFFARSNHSIQSILDFGSGEYQYQDCFSQSIEYLTLDNHTKSDYKSLQEVTQKFDLILCIEVLEHTSNPSQVIQELMPFLTPKGTLIISTPLNARIHRCPKDYFRFSVDFFEDLKHARGIGKIKIKTRGNNIDTLLSKMINLYLKAPQSLFFTLLSILFLPLLFLLYLIHYMNFSFIPSDDPLGFLVEIQASDGLHE